MSDTTVEPHSTSVMYTRRLRDLLRKRYWAVCFFCDWRRGPFVEKMTALSRADEFANDPCLDQARARACRNAMWAEALNEAKATSGIDDV